MKKIITICATITALIVAVILAVVLMHETPLEKTISLRGYTINVPKNFTASSDGTIFDGKAREVGKFVLISEKVGENKIPEFSGVSVSGDVKTTVHYENIKKNEFASSAGKVVQYYVTDVLNPEPYAISLTFLKGNISGKLCDRIGETITIPEIGKRPPEKNITAPKYEELDDTVVYKVTLLDGSVLVNNIELIDMFMERQSNKQSTAIGILTYVQSEVGLMELENWKYIESDSGRGFMYLYYDEGDGEFTYDNNPVSFESIAKDTISDEGITSYNLKVGDAVTETLLDVPLNLYRENADELLSYKTDKSDTETVIKILQKIMTKKQFSKIKVTKDGDTVKITFNDSSVFDAVKLSKDAAVIFCLLSDVNTIEVTVKGGERYIIKRSELSKGLKINLEKAADSADRFSEFTEEIENITPAEPELEEENDEVLYSATVVIARGSKVTHPRTGNKVVVDDYAEKYGFGYYLGKPIVCTVKKNGDIYKATAVCNGKTILSQTLGSRAEAQKAIDTIKAYS